MRPGAEARDDAALLGGVARGDEDALAVAAAVMADVGSGGPAGVAAVMEPRVAVVVVADSGRCRDLGCKVGVKASARGASRLVADDLLQFRVSRKPLAALFARNAARLGAAGRSAWT